MPPTASYTATLWRFTSVVKTAHRRSVASVLRSFRSSAVWVGARLYPGWLSGAKIQVGGHQLQESRLQFYMRSI